MLGRLLEAQQRERMHIVAQIGTIKGLMPLLMKRRNGSHWSRAERIALQGQLRALSDLSPYLITLALPGSFLLVPVLAWWLDRRRGLRGDLTAAAAGENAETENSRFKADTLAD